MLGKIFRKKLTQSSGSTSNKVDALLTQRQWMRRLGNELFDRPHRPDAARPTNVDLAVRAPQFFKDGRQIAASQSPHLQFRLFLDQSPDIRVQCLVGRLSARRINEQEREILLYTPPDQGLGQQVHRTEATLDTGFQIEVRSGPSMYDVIGCHILNEPLEILLFT